MDHNTKEDLFLSGIPLYKNRLHSFPENLTLSEKLYKIRV
jgi:hypothetical protein